jgi:hypothetical protein
VSLVGNESGDVPDVSIVVLAAAAVPWASRVVDAEVAGVYLPWGSAGCRRSTRGKTTTRRKRRPEGTLVG